jgi:glycosyltransferase involved in cell wall biosynthesis
VKSHRLKPNDRWWTQLVLISMNTLYICYQSLLDPLTQSQVVAYLEGLAIVGYRPILVTFEPRQLSAEENDQWRRRLSGLGIIWRHLRYHKRPTVPATALDVTCGILLSLWLIVRFRVRLVHARSHVPGVMAAGLQLLTSVPFLFDIRGFLAEEYADAGVWPADGRLYRTTKRVERWLVGRAAGIVVLTERAMALLPQWYASETNDKPLVVIPCCVDRRQMHEKSPAEMNDLDRSRRVTSLIYVGKLGGNYATGAMVDLFASARRSIPSLRWTVFTQGDSTNLRRHAAALGLDSLITIGQVQRDALIAELSRASAGICLYRGDRSAPACSPTKIAEYLAAGLPVVASSGMGDIDRILCDHGRLAPSSGGRQPVGVLVDERDAADLERAATELKRLLADPAIGSRCRAAAQRGFDLEAIGWARYRRMYGRLIGHSRSRRSRSDRSGAETRDEGSGMGSAPVNEVDSSAIEMIS